MSDLRSLPDAFLKAYLYAIGGWGLALAILYPFDHLQWALTLCFPLALWQAVVTGWWWVRVRGSADLALQPVEVSSGVRSVARILAASGLLPGIVYLAQDPLQPEAWGPLVGVGALVGVGWLAANLGPRISADPARIGILVATGLVLPLGATGTITWAWARGWFDRVIEPIVG